MMKNILKPTEFLLPAEDVDYGAWAVVACDQFTSEEKYWKDLSQFVGDKASALRVILPEIYLAEKDVLAPETVKTMKDYLARGVLKKTQAGFILTVRRTPYVPRRIGLMASVDLEEYDYTPGKGTPIRATEGTIAERIPPRLEIRKDAPAEFSHIMLLYDDERRTINERLYENRARYNKIYDFDLNMGGGHAEGYFISDCGEVMNLFASLAEEDRMLRKYGDKTPFLFAAGDGNHSLATAKEHWNAVKKNLTAAERENHPARYCLVEIVNVYDEGIYFEPIHRFVSGVDKQVFERGLNALGSAAFSYSDGRKHAGTDALPESIAAVDAYIESYIAAHGGKVDYVHGMQNLRDLVAKDSSSDGICFEPMEKGDLFAYVVRRGALPKKTFSMGEGVEKRYYLEGKLIQ